MVQNQTCEIYGPTVTISETFIFIGGVGPQRSRIYDFKKTDLLKKAYNGYCKELTKTTRPFLVTSKNGHRRELVKAPMLYNF